MTTRRQFGLVLGVPGVGKTTVIQAVARRQPSVGQYDFADLMLSGDSQGIHRDQLQYLPMSQRRELFTHAKRELVRILDSGVNEMVLLEAHFVLRIDGKLCMLGDGLLELATPSVVLLVDAPTVTIMSRREKDSIRSRASETKQQICEQQSANYIRFLDIVSALGLAPHVIVNTALDSAVESSLRYINRLLSSE